MDRNWQVYDALADKFIHAGDIDPTAPPERYKEITWELLLSLGAAWIYENLEEQT